MSHTAPQEINDKEDIEMDAYESGSEYSEEELSQKKRDLQMCVDDIRLDTEVLCGYEMFLRMAIKYLGLPQADVIELYRVHEQHTTVLCKIIQLCSHDDSVLSHIIRN